MSKLARGAEHRKSYQIVPVKNNRAMAVQANLQQLQSDLENFSNICVDLFDTTDYLVSDEEIERGEATVAELPLLRQRWAAVDRRAEPEEIAFVLALLQAAFPNTKSRFVAVAAGHIRATKATLYEVHRGCSSVSCKYEFLSIKSILQEVNAAGNHSRHVRRKLKRDLASELAIIKEEAPAARAAWSVESDKWERRYQAVGIKRPDVY